MKTFISLLAVYATAATAAPCDLARLAPLLTNTAVQACARETGYNLVSSGQPSMGQLVQICRTDSCKQAFGALEALNLPQCEVGSFTIKPEYSRLVYAACATLINSNAQ